MNKSHSLILTDPYDIPQPVIIIGHRQTRRIAWDPLEDSDESEKPTESGRVLLIFQFIPPITTKCAIRRQLAVISFETRGFSRGASAGKTNSRVSSAPRLSASVRRRSSRRHPVRGR